MLLLIDNYDSFTYNLAQFLGQLDQTVQVVRNDAISVDAIADLAPERIVISPGPCTPDKAGISLALIERFAGQIPILGVCLGHQAIGQALGGAVVRADRVMHGKRSQVFHDQRGLFTGVPNPFWATRYHSLIVDRGTLPASLQVSAKTWDDEIMGIRYRDDAGGDGGAEATARTPLVGLQFHPESIATEAGLQILENFVRISSTASPETQE